MKTTSNYLFTVVMAVCIGIAILFAVSLSGYAQTVIRPTDKVLKDTVIKNVSYKLYVGAKGGRYVVRTSKTGSQYKQYFKSK